jgi:hypothetical protein
MTYLDWLNVAACASHRLRNSPNPADSGDMETMIMAWSFYRKGYEGYSRVPGATLSPLQSRRATAGAPLDSQWDGSL